MINPRKESSGSGLGGIFVPFLVACLFIVFILGVIIPMGTNTNSNGEEKLCQEAASLYPGMITRLDEVGGGKVCNFQVHGAGGFTAWVSAREFNAGLVK